MTQTETPIPAAGAHTPGPWVVGGTNGIGQLAVKDANFIRIALVDEQFAPTRDGNARLIAAAPEMLAALKECERFVRALGKGDEVAAAAAENARAAIAKAEGRA